MKHTYEWQEHITEVRASYTVGMRWGFAMGTVIGACAMLIGLLAVMT